MAVGTREDSGDTVDATTEEEDMVAESTATEAMEAADTATWTWTTLEPEKTAQTTETQEAGGTPGDRLEIGKMAGIQPRPWPRPQLRRSGRPWKP